MSAITNGLMVKYVFECGDEWGKTRLAKHYELWCAERGAEQNEKSRAEWEGEPFRVRELPK